MNIRKKDKTKQISIFMELSIINSCLKNSHPRILSLSLIRLERHIFRKNTRTFCGGLDLHYGNFVISHCNSSKITLSKKLLEYPSYSLGLEQFYVSKIVKIFLDIPRFESPENIESNVTIALK